MAQKIDRRVLEQRIREVEGLSSDERSALLELLHTKRYGLVWEDKPEDVEERLRESLPVLIEDKKLALVEGGEDAPNHILIEGDNLEALTVLTYTHEGKIDVIYIDPPYNTKNKDFVYNDKFIDYEDEYRHSKWLSFMSKRLRISKRLLSDKGVIFISIDDNEDAQLKLLCDEIFGNRNKIADIIWKSRKSVSSDTFVSKNHNYTPCYAKSLSLWNKEEFRLPSSNDKFSNPDNDPRGPWTADPFDAPNIRPNLTYSITNPNTGKEYWPPKGRCWRTTEEQYKEYLQDNRIVFGKKGKSKPQLKRFLDFALTKGEAAISIWDDVGTTTNGTQLLMSIFDGEVVFTNPKPISLIQRMLLLIGNKNAAVLDFFAGSGTTLHATMQLNAEDGGKRQCILVTNNENNICRDVTYERNKRVINGYTTPKGVEVEGLKGNNLRYYRTEFVDRDSSMTNKRKLMAAATELLNIKQDIYKEVHTFGSLKLRSHIARYFAERGKQMLIIYKVEAIEYLVKEIAQMPADTHILIYVFSINNYAMDADFEDVADKVTLCALPAAIYNAYLKVLPKKKADVAVEESEEKSNEESLLFPEEDEQ